MEHDNKISGNVAPRRITMKEVGGTSAWGGLEAEGQELFASCLSEAILKRSAPEPKGALSPLSTPNIPRYLN